MMLEKPPLSGTLLMIAGVASLAINDALAKMLTAHYSALQILFARNVLALPVAVLIALLAQGLPALRTRTPALHLLRGLLWVVATLLFFTGIHHLGLAKSTALLLLAPVLIVAIAALLLGETVSRTHWLAVGSGLLGALIIVRPGFDAFEPVALLPLAAALMAALLMLSARRVDHRESVWTVMLYLTGAAVLVSAVVVPFVWKPLQAEHTAHFLALAVFGTAGIVLMTQAFRLAPATRIAPLEYTALLWASLFGWLFWGEYPDSLTWLGMLIIVCSGVYSLRVGET